MDPAAMIRVAQGERDVAHGEPGADQEDVLVPLELERVACPGVARVADARHEPLVGSRRVGRREVPDREQRTVGAQRAAVRQRERDGVGLRRDRHGLARHTDQRHGRRAARPLERVREVRAVEPPRDERAAGQRGLASPDMAQEVVRVVVEGAHPAGRNVQRMARGRRSVRDPADAALGSLDEEDPRDRRTCLTQEMDGDHRAAEAGPDDRDRARVHVQRLDCAPRNAR